MKKCSFKKGGYAEDVCDAMQKAIDTKRRTKASKGIFSGSMVNMKSMERIGHQLIIKSGGFTENGILLNFCPFCGEKVRDDSED